MSDLMAKAEQVKEAAAAAALAENTEEPGKSVDRAGTSEIQAFRHYSNDWPDQPTDHHAISGIPDAFAYIGKLDYSGLKAKQNEMGKAVDDLKDAQLAVGNLTFLLRSKFEAAGRTIETFCSFVELIADVATAQGRLAQALSAGIQTQRRILESAEHEAMQIAEKTIAACKRIEADALAREVTIAFTCMAIGTSIAGAAVNGGMAFALLSSLTTGLEGAYQVQGKDVPVDEVDGLGGEDLDTVLNGDKGMYALLKKSEQDLDKAERELASVIRQDHDRLDEKIENYDPDAGGLIDGRGGLRPTEDVLKVDLEELYRYATGHGSGKKNDNLPVLAENLSLVTYYLYTAASVGGDAMGESTEPWESLLDRLIRLVGKTSTKLFDGGTVLGKAAQDFARQDGYNAAWIAQTGEEFMHRNFPLDPPTEPQSVPDNTYAIEKGPHKGKQIPY